MPYVPPHKRRGELCKPEIMGESSRKPVIRRAKDSTHKTLVVSDRSLVKFEVYQGERYVHLSDSKLYTAMEAEEDTPGREKSLSDAFTESLSLTDRSFTSIIPRITTDLTVALERLEDNHPKLVLRFGRILFLSPPDLDTRTLSVDALEGCKKTFEAGVSSELFSKLREIAASSMQEQVQVTQKCHYSFLVRDRERPHNHLMSCVCSPAQNNKSIVLNKVKSQPLRHMVTDVLCVGKTADLRVFLYTERRYEDLPEAEMDALKALADAAVIDEQVKGGLKWPLGKDCFMNRWSAEDAQFRSITILTGENARWKFTVANRSLRLTHEVKVSPLGFKADEGTPQLHMLLDLAKNCLDRT